MTNKYKIGDKVVICGEGINKQYNGLSGEVKSYSQSTNLYLIVFDKNNNETWISENHLKLNKRFLKVLTNRK